MIKNKLLLLALLPSLVNADMTANYSNVPLSSMVETISKTIDKNITYNSESANVPISLSMPNELPPQQVYKLFLQSLKVSGLKAIETEKGIISIIPVKTVIDDNIYSDQNNKTVVFNLKNVKAGDMQESLGNVVSYSGFVSPVGETKLLVSDSESKVKNIRSLVYQLDYKKSDPIVYRTVTLNNLQPSKIEGDDDIEVKPFDSINRVVIKGHKSKVDQFEKSILSLDSSLKTVYTRLLITSMTSTFTDDFNIVGVFQKGALSASLTSITFNTFSKATDGISAVLNLFKENTDVTIHSKPYLQLLEGKVGSFNVGREVPIVVSQIDQESGQRINNIERKKIGLQISLIAKVRPDGLIALDLDQNLSSISKTQLDQASDLITDDQSLKTSLLLEPGKVYAVGGVTDKRHTLTKTTSPFFDFLDTDDKSEQSQEITIFIETSLKPFVS